MVRIIFTFTFLNFCFCFELFSQQPGVSPLNPDYIEYYKIREKNLQKISDNDGRFLGFIPEPVLPNTNIDPTLNKTDAILPEYYDWRTSGMVSSVKNQDSCGSCWAFSTMAVLESRLMILGYPETDLSENNLKECHGFVNSPCYGGNTQMAMAYFTRGDGPIDEKNDIYVDSVVGCHSGKTPSWYVTDLWYIPKDIPSIKQAILDYGPVSSAFYWADSFYYAPASTYYYPNKLNGTNHLITIVGWDDSKVTKGGTGAWIAKNSWGIKFGEKGYFYISYNDTRINLFVRNFPNIIEYTPDKTLYYYDKLGSTNGYGKPNEGSGSGLVKFTATGNQKITKVATFIYNASTTVDFDIFSSFNGTILTDVIASLKNQTCKYAGYYTFDLPVPVLVKSGNNFYIRAKYKSTAPGAGNVVPIEMEVKNYASPSIESGKCWWSYDGNSNWTAFGANTNFSYDVCIRAYTVPAGSIPETFELCQNYPNPFNPSTTITIKIPAVSRVKVTVHNILGEEVKVLYNGVLPPGERNLVWDGKDKNGLNSASGVYFYSLESDKLKFTRKMIYLR